MDNDNIVKLNGNAQPPKPQEPDHPPYHNYRFTFQDRLNRDPQTANGFCAFGPEWVAIMQGPGEIQFMAFTRDLTTVEIVPEVDA